MNATGTRRVVIALQMAGKPGQRKMAGILDYLAEKNLRWELRFVRHREDFSPDFVRALAENPVDGILYSFDTVPTVEAELAKIDIPTVGLDVFDQSPLCGRTRPCPGGQTANMMRLRGTKRNSLPGEGKTDFPSLLDYTPVTKGVNVSRSCVQFRK